jgi:hypothetical protein
MSSTTTTRTAHRTATLYLAFEFGNGIWRLGFTTGPGQKPRQRTVPARDGHAVLREIDAARKRFGLSAVSAVVSCYEAGERTAWNVVRVPSDAEEDSRQLHRELLTAKRDRTRMTNRIRGLLANQGLEIDFTRDVVAQLRVLRRWDGSALPAALRRRVEREWEKAQFLTQQIQALLRERRKLIREGADPTMAKVLQLAHLKGVGINSAWLHTMEFFGWREFENGKRSVNRV